MKPTLPTNFKDDILNTSVEGKRRYRMIYNDDNTVSLKDVTPYDQTGSDFGAGDINLTNQAVNQSADAGKIIDDPDTAEATTEEGYIAGVQLFNYLNDSLIRLVKPLYPHGLPLIPIMESETQDGIAISAINTYSGSSVINAFDENADTVWMSSTIIDSGKTETVNLWLKVDLGSAKSLNYALVNIVYAGTLVVQGSNDDNTWNDISNTVSNTTGENYIKIINYTPYRYIRLFIKTQTNNLTTRATMGRVREFQLYEVL